MYLATSSSPRPMCICCLQSWQQVAWRVPQTLSLFVSAYERYLTAPRSHSPSLTAFRHMQRPNTQTSKRFLPFPSFSTTTTIPGIFGLLFFHYSQALFPTMETSDQSFDLPSDQTPGLSPDQGSDQGSDQSSLQSPHQDGFMKEVQDLRDLRKTAQHN